MGLTSQIGGFWMLLVLGVLTLTTQMPVWVLLIGVASGFACLGLFMNAFALHTLSVLPLRVIGLLEHDLLQALPLYVFIGMLLQQLLVADTLFVAMRKGFTKWLGSAAADSVGTALAALGIGSLIAPMNGSVASSSMLLSRLVVPRLTHLNSARTTALIGVAATIGVVIPPSLVLILLGDTMMRSHTEATHLPGFVNSALSSTTIINTQGVFNAALLPGIAIVLLWAVVACWQSRKSDASIATVKTALHTAHTERFGLPQISLSVLTVSVILLLLVGVFTGKLFAVEAAATGALLLLCAGLLSRALTRQQWRDLLQTTLQLSGALMALLVGATVFSLIFRLFGTDRWLTETLLSSPYPPWMTAAGVLVLVAMCAWVLDAFEMIFVIIPIVAPPLIAMLGDAQQSAVLLLLVLQLSFLMPPMGYAVMIARNQSGSSSLPIRQLLTALMPFVLVQLIVLLVVFAVPQVVHLLDPPLVKTTQSSDADIVRQMQDMSAPQTIEPKP
jgi:TRAP-type mannitol/chloroaromatic compound transport system permease large subunit